MDTESSATFHAVASMLAANKLYCEWKEYASNPVFQMSMGKRRREDRGRKGEREGRKKGSTGDRKEGCDTMTSGGIESILYDRELASFPHPFEEGGE